MAIHVAVGQAFDLDGRDACANAIRSAMKELKRSSISIAFLFASHEYEAEDVMTGAISQLGSTPIIGMSTSGELTSFGSNQRSVTVALLSSREINAKSDWVATSGPGIQYPLEDLISNISVGMQPTLSSLMLVSDGFNGNGVGLSESPSPWNGFVFGATSGGELISGSSVQFGGSKVGTGGLAGALISGVRIASGVAHGWQQVGASFKLSEVKDAMVTKLDDQPATDSYARLLGHQPGDWGFPPLNTLVRLYPVGIQGDNGSPMAIRAPVWANADGSLQMNADINEGEIAHLLVGSREGCIDAARLATFEALSSLGSSKLALALVFADASWQMLFEGQPGAEIHAIREVLGQNVPIAGGYSLGQLTRDRNSRKIELLNQHIEVVLIGE